MSVETCAINKEELKEFIKGVIRASYSMGRASNCAGKDHLLDSINSLPLVTVVMEEDV